MTEEWTPDSWRDHPVNQQPEYHGVMPRAVVEDIPPEFREWMPRAVFDVIAPFGEPFDEVTPGLQARGVAEEWGLRLAERIVARYGTPTPNQEADRD